MCEGVGEGCVKVWGRDIIIMKVRGRDVLRCGVGIYVNAWGRDV